jgi:hypothetical protein
VCVAGLAAMLSALPPAHAARPGYYWYSPYPGYWHSPCYPFASCTALLQYRVLERRLQRREELRRHDPEPSPPAAMPMGPPGPESELRPEYRDSGKARPEFDGVGALRPDLLQRRHRSD